MTGPVSPASAPRVAAESLAIDALQWLLGSARHVGGDLVWAETADDDELDPTLYSGGAGIVLALLEAYRHLGDDRYADAAVRGARAIAAAVEDTESSSLYFGLTGMAFALRRVCELLGDTEAGAAADHGLDLVRARFDGERWSDQFELLGGNAGIALGALAVGDPDLAVLAVTPYLRTPEPTAGGVTWEVRTGMAARFHHISHGTLGIVHALAAVGAATGRPELTELALAGAADVVSRNEAGNAGFVVPHSDPQHRPDIVERYSFGWCHGPAGDAQVFRLLAAVTADPAWQDLADRCWRTVIDSGLPRRLRPGFWDNSGRCCGTAGVLALACDRFAEGRIMRGRIMEGRIMQGRGDLEFATVLVEDLIARATVDDDGARWSNHEHRVTPSELEPRTGWAMGNAGIIRELLRFARAAAGADPAYAVSWPDQPAVDCPAIGVRTGAEGGRPGFCE